MTSFMPDCENIVAAARNIKAPRLPLYEHLISVGQMEKITGDNFGALFYGDHNDRVEFFRRYFAFFARMGYDAAPYECCIGGALPYGGCLGGHKESVIHDRADFERYPWDEIPERFFAASGDIFAALAEAVPSGMAAVGGVGNGVFECVEDIVGYVNLCYISDDDPELYADLFRRVGDISHRIWERFMREYSSPFCVLRFGDDLGYKSNTLISARDIKEHVLPVYRRIISLVHSYGKPFLLHSCGNLFGVMDDIIATGIDAKHSNEDQIAPFPVWVERYGDRIGNFGGIDTDALCRLDRQQLREYIVDVLKKCEGRGGIAFGSGNSIPDYVPTENYIAMTEIVREYRGDTK